MSGHQSARMGTCEWLTPPGIVQALGPFDLDPCAPAERPWDTAKRHYTLADDGLAQPWEGRVWCNPPFGLQARRWLAKMAEHDNGIALVPARVETRAWCESVWGKARLVSFLRGRPHFYRIDGSRAPGNSGAPIALIAYGAANADALRRTGLGTMVREVVGDAWFC